jgi:hypothetical protein
MRVPLGRDGWCLASWQESSLPDRFEFQADEALAGQFLNDFSEDINLVNDLRRELDLGDEFDESDVQTLIAAQLSQGLLRVYRPKREIVRASLSAEPDVGPAFPLDARASAPAPSPSPVPEGSTFPNDADLAAIAEVQKAAAALGIPFCEECAKAAAAAK